MAKSDLEDQFLTLLHCEKQRNNINLPDPEREWRFCDGRKWRFDFAWPSLWVAVEIEGGSWIGGRHANPMGMHNDCDKYNAAVARGWRVLRFTGRHFREPDAVFEVLLQAMGFFGEVDDGTTQAL